MRFPKCPFALAALVSLSSIAQQTGPLSGSWMAKCNTSSGIPRVAKVVVRDDSGTWQTQASVIDNMCVGRVMPLSVGKVEPDSFELSVAGSKALAGCEDWVVQMKRVDEKTFEGKWSDGRKVLLMRQ